MIFFSLVFLLIFLALFPLFVLCLSSGLVFFFFFKQKTAYEIGVRLVGSVKGFTRKLSDFHKNTSFVLVPVLSFLFSIILQKNPL